MRVTLFAPMRTLLNLDTSLALGEAGALCEALQQAVDEVSPRFEARVLRDSTPDNNLQKFFHLDNDSVTWYATPLVRLTPNDEDAAAFHHKAAQGGFLQSNLNLRSIHLDMFDNTIAVFTVDLDLDLVAAQTAVEATEDVSRGALTAPAALEAALTRYTMALAAQLQPSLAEPFIRALRAVTDRRRLLPFMRGARLSSVVRKPRDWVAFDDITAHAVADGWTWDPQVSPLVWSHRVYHVDTFADGEAEASSGLFRIKDPQGPMVIKHGTSYLNAAARKEKYFEVSVYAQYFAVLFDTVKVSQRRLEQILSEPAESVALRPANEKADRIESLFVEITAELSDLTSSLQDINAEIFAAIASAFNFSELASSIKERLEASEMKLSRVLEIRTRLQQRLVGVMLFFIGGAQLLSLVIDLYAVGSEHEQSDAVPGVMDLIMSNPIDLTLNVLTLSLFLIGLIYVLMKPDRMK